MNNKFFQIIGGSSIAIAIFLFAVIFFNPLSPLLTISPNSGLIPDTASTYKINSKVTTSFAEYDPLNPIFDAQIVSTAIQNLNKSG